MEFLVLDHTPADDDWEIGDIVDIRPDGFEWGTGERVSPFEVYIVPDAILSALGIDSVEEAWEYLRELPTKRREYRIVAPDLIRKNPGGQEQSWTIPGLTQRTF